MGIRDEEDEDVLPEYDLSGGVRGKYVDRYRQGINVVLLDPDVAAEFPDSKAVNEVLRSPVGRGRLRPRTSAGASRLTLYLGVVKRTTAPRSDGRRRPPEDTTVRAVGRSRDGGVAKRMDDVLDALGFGASASRWRAMIDLPR